jgi:hypothetical protein
MFSLLSVALLFMPGCGSQSQNPSPPPIKLPLAAGQFLSLTITDTPPAGVTVLFFQLSLTGASLNPQSGQAVSLMSSSNPIPVNLTQLQTDSAFLLTATVILPDLSNSNGQETFNSMSVTFANPQLTIFNGSGATIGSGVNACANNTVCELTPSTAPLTLTFSSAPFPITLPLSPLAFQLDVHLNTVIQPDLSLNLAAPNGVTLSKLPPPPSGSTISSIGSLVGTIQTVPSAGAAPAYDFITLQTGDGRTLEISLDSNTTYNYPSSVCSANNASCLAVGQIVKVDVSLQDNASGAILIGGLLASNITYIQPAGKTVVEGNIISLSTSGGNTVMVLALQDFTPPPGPLGRLASVTVPNSGVTYAVDWGGFAIPSGITFASASDLAVGQEVLVTAQGAVVRGPLPPENPSGWNPADIDGASLTANSITLEPSQITGVVSAWATPNASTLTFTLSTYANYFLAPPSTAGAPPTTLPVNLNVQATSATTYANLTPDDFSGLAVGDIISVKGWLFPYQVIPAICKADAGCAPIGVVVAEAVVGWPGPTPLF